MRHEYRRRSHGIRRRADGSDLPNPRRLRRLLYCLGRIALFLSPARHTHPSYKTVVIRQIRHFERVLTTDRRIAQIVVHVEFQILERL